MLKKADNDKKMPRKTRIVRKMLKLKKKWEAQYPPEKVNSLLSSHIIENIAHYATFGHWKTGLIQIQDSVQGLVIGLD